MSFFGLFLVLLSTFMHAAWNLMARTERDEGRFFRDMLLVSSVLGFLPAVVFEWHAQAMTPISWVCLAGSGISCGLYYLFLARAYSFSDFTIVYPIARSLPVLLVGVGDILLHRRIGVFGWLGMAAVVLGCVLTPLRSFKELDARRYANKASLWMVLTALGTVGYTLLDKRASATLKPGPASAACYGYFFFLFSFLAYSVLHRLFPTSSSITTTSSPSSPSSSSFSSNPSETAPLPRVRWARVVLASLCNYGAYFLVLWAYQVTVQASYVVAVRQASIVIGVVAAFLIFKEEGFWVRIAGTGLITSGICLIQVLG